MSSYKYSQNNCYLELVVKDNRMLSVQKIRSCSMSIPRDILYGMVHVNTKKLKYDILHANPNKRKTRHAACQSLIQKHVQNKRKKRNAACHEILI